MMTNDTLEVGRAERILTLLFRNLFYIGLLLFGIDALLQMINIFSGFLFDSTPFSYSSFVLIITEHIANHIVIGN